MKTGKYFNCIVCRKIYYRFLADLRKGKPRFCSRKCFYKYEKDTGWYWKGKKRGRQSEESIRKTILNRKWYHHSSKTREKIGNILRGRVYPERRGKNNLHWRGGRQSSGNGYVYLLKRDHPFSDKRGRILEHRYVMEQKIGRYLRPDEIIDHINCIKHDNRIENLQIVTHGENIRLGYLRKKLKLNK